jgi:superoxide dismutase, Fe-Mn family
MHKGEYSMEKNCSRREFMKTAAQAGAALTLASAPGMLFAETKPSASAEKTVTMVKLPYAMNALEPFISARTVDLHYNKHHQGYLTRITGWIDTHPDFQNQTLEELILKYKNGVRFEEAIFQYSILLLNHNWYWQSLKPKAGGAPKGKIEKMIVASYGSFNAFKKAILDESMKLGVGWVWIVQDGDKIKAYRSEYLDTPLLKGYRPLLAIDVWEHAYYLDYQNDRQKYVEAVLNNLLNWEFAEKNIV